MPDWIVCGWYTPDYRPYWHSLRADLEAIGAPHDFVEVAKLSGEWEDNVSRKAQHALDAINRNPNKTIILLDVDCSVPGGIEGLNELADAPGDVAFHFNARWNTNWSSRLVRIGVRSGTMVFKPTDKARRFVQDWIDESRNAPRYSVDQDTLAIVLGKGNTSIGLLESRFCARPKDGVSFPVILHDAASRTAIKAGRLARAWSRLKSGRTQAESVGTKHSVI